MVPPAFLAKLSPTPYDRALGKLSCAHARDFSLYSSPRKANDPTAKVENFLAEHCGDSPLAEKAKGISALFLKAVRLRDYREIAGGPARILPLQRVTVSSRPGPVRRRR